jgi:hypothetical protein
MDRPTVPENVVVADGDSLERLFARFNAVGGERAPADSSAHQSVIERLACNQRRAAALGWSEFVLERASASGRLELRGVRAPGRDHELVPDAISSDGDTPGAMSASTEPRVVTEARHIAEGRIGSDLANVAWRFRARRLGDVER